MTERLHRQPHAWVILILLISGGCVTPSGQSDPPTTQSILETSRETTSVDYWLAKPAVASVAAGSYDDLWHAIDRVIQPSFPLSQHDYRAGVISTMPVLSAQFFEFWRADTVTIPSYIDSSIATVRRTIQFSIERSGSKFLAQPKVVVERFVLQERQLLTAKLPEAVFKSKPVRGSREADAGQEIADGYWYATGRDHALEQNLAERVRSALR